jgi:ribosomal protein S27E
MTEREVLERGVRRIRLIMLWAIVVTIVWFLSGIFYFYLALCWGGVLLGLTLAVFGRDAFSAMRCPRCGDELGSSIDRRLRLLATLIQVVFGRRAFSAMRCPSCGEEFGLPIDGD